MRYICFGILLFLITACGNEGPAKNLIKTGYHYLSFNRGGNPKPDFKFNCFYSSFDPFSESLKLHYYYDGRKILMLNLNSGEKELVTIDKMIAEKCGFANANAYRVGGVVYIANSKGEIYRLKDSIPILEFSINNDAKIKKRQLMMNEAMGFNRDFTFLNTHELIFQCTPNIAGMKKQMRNYPVFAKLDLETKKITFFDYAFRDEFLDKIRPLQSDIYQTLSGDKFLVSYMFSPEVDIISLKTGKKAGVTFFRSTYQTEEIPALDENYTDFEKERFGIEAAHYGMLVYNPYKNCYYRVFYKQLPERNKQGDFTIPLDRKVSIAIFDSKGKWLGEVNIKNAFVSAITPTKKGFLLNVNEVKVEDKVIRFKEYFHD